MFYFRSGTRMFQTLSNLRQGTYTLFNNQLNEQIEISSYAAKLIRKAYTSRDFSAFDTCEERCVFFDELIETGYIIEADLGKYKENNIYLSEKCAVSFPLTSLNMELLNACNLRCKHCYGSFSNIIENDMVPFEWIQRSIQELNVLQVRNIALTGGEATLHPHFLEIVKLLLSNGFNLCIFTNGYNPDVINQLLDISKMYKLTIKVSLDGPEEIHNWIRGKENAFEKVIQSLDEISKYKNVTLYISTIVLRKNISFMDCLTNYVKNRYPQAIHTKDLAFPMGNASNSLVFSLNEYDQFKDILIPHASEELYSMDSLPVNNKRFRCSGGVSQCTLMPTGQIKICNAACDPQFYFKYNAYEKGIAYAWNHCGVQISRIRQERPKHTSDCKTCSIKNLCTTNDCRVMAWIYSKDATRSNPLSCRMELDKVRGNAE